MKKLIISITAISAGLLLFWILLIVSDTVPMHKPEIYSYRYTYYSNEFGIENDQLRIASGIFIGLGSIASLVLGILVLCLFKTQSNGLTMATGILSILNFLAITVIATMILGIITAVRKQ